MAARGYELPELQFWFFGEGGETPPSFRQMRQLEGLFVLWTEAMLGEEQWLTAELVLTDCESKKGIYRPGRTAFTVYYISN